MREFLSKDHTSTRTPTAQNTFSRHHVLLFLLLLALCLVTPASASSIHVEKRQDNSLYLTNDKRKAPAQPLASEEPPSTTQATPQTEPNEPSTEDESSARLTRSLEIGFTRGRPERIVPLFNFFPQQVTPELLEKQQDRVRLFLELFFQTFGPTESWTPGSTSQQRLHLGRIYGAFKDQIDSVECNWRHESFLAPLRSRQGAVELHMSVCHPEGNEDAPWIKDIGVTLVEPSPEFTAKAESFKKEYSHLLSSLSQKRREQKEQAALAPPEKGTIEPIPVEKAKPAAPSSAPPKAMHETPPAMPAPQDHVTMPPGSDMGTGPSMNMGQLSLLLGFFSGTFITLALATSFFMYLLYCMTLYIITRKFNLPRPWLAWIPIAQIHPQVLAAGLPGWWTAALIASIFASMLPFLGVVLSLAATVAFVYLWMRISERLDVNKWLGLLMLLPLVQLIYPAWLALKKDRLRHGIDLRNILVKTLLAFLLLSTLSWAVTTYLIVPAMEPLLSAFGSFQNASPGQSHGLPLEIPPEMLPEAQKTAPDVPTFKSLDRQAYEKLLADSQAPEPGMGDKPFVRMGPVLLRQGTFWDDPQAPHFWIEVILPLIHNLALDTACTLTMTEVLDANGNNVYDKDNDFEQETFLNLSFNVMEHPTPHLETLRDVHLKAGVTEKDLRSARGELQLFLPLNLQVLELGAGEIGQTRELHGLRATLESIEQGEAKVVLQGDLKNHITTFAYDAQGTPLERQYSSWSTMDDRKDVSFGFAGKVSRLELIVSSGIMEKSYPFVLEIEAKD